MNQFEINADVRESQGKGASRRLRHAGRIPAIVYGADQAPQSISLLHSQFIRHLEQEAIYSHVLTLKIGDKIESVVLKDMQRHPFKPIIMHVDFLRTSATAKLHIHVPFHFLNEDTCVGVKTGGGAISHHLPEIEILCLPQNLPEFIAIDLANMNVGDVVHLADLTLPEGVELPALTHGDNLPVVSIHKQAGAAGEGTEEA
jgi:large subunit ribosomal protein L25